MFIKRLIILTTILLLQACAATIDSSVHVSLQPLHGVARMLSDRNLNQAQLLDNDGNVYSTFWKLDQGEKSGFASVVKKCKGQVYDKIKFGKSLQLSEIERLRIAPSLSPSLSKEYAQCISNSGLLLVSEKVFLPAKFRLIMYKGHSAKGNYMPVGAVYHLRKKGATFLDVFQHTKACKAKVFDTVNAAVTEEYFSGYVYVSLESHVEAMRACMTEYAYDLTRVTDEVTERHLIKERYTVPLSLQNRLIGGSHINLNN